MVVPCSCRLCGAFVYIDEGPEAVCWECAQLLEDMNEIAARAEANAEPA